MDFDNVQTRVADPGSVGIMLVSKSGKTFAGSSRNFSTNFKNGAFST